MRLLQGSTFAHPVVCPFLDDVSNNGFHFKEFTVSADGTSYRISTEIEINNHGVLGYLNRNQACFAILMESRSFFYRKLHRFPSQKQELVIDGFNLYGTVDCVPLIVATTDLPEYELPDMNDDYKNIKISLKEGDVLAIGAGRTFVAEKEYDPLQRLSSIMQVIIDPEIEPGSMDVDLNEEKITILLCADDHAKYSTLSKLSEAAPILMQKFALPALQEAITEMAKEGGTNTDRRWELALKKRIDEKKISIQGSTSSYTACRLLDGPISSGLSSLDALIAQGGD